MAGGDGFRGGRRWVLAAAGLPLPILVILAGLRIREDSTAEAVGRLITSPVSLVAVMVFAAYVALRPGPATTRGRAIGWLASGVLICLGALGVDLFGGVTETITDVIATGLGMSLVADGYRGLVTAPAREATTRH